MTPDHAQKQSWPHPLKSSTVLLYTGYNYTNVMYDIYMTIIIIIHKYIRNDNFMTLYVIMYIYIIAIANVVVSRDP